LSLLALVVAVLALVVAVTGRRRVSAGARGRRRPPPAVGPMSSEEVTARIEALQAVADTSLRHLAVVRYDAFGDMGGHLSWSMALLDDSGDGVVLTSIHGRSDSRTYAKNVTGWTAGQQLSPEEEEAIGFARSPRSPG
jgi:uncharacterized protein DUF4446